MGHDHHHHHHELTGKKLLLTIVLNVIITVAQIIAGFVSGSLSLLSDALHNFSDIIALFISFLAHKLTHKSPSLSKTFGYKRAEILAAFVNGLALIMVAFFIVEEAIVRLFNPEPVASGIVIITAAVAIAANGISALLLFTESKHNLNIRSSFLHLFTDMLASVAVLIGGVIMYFLGWYWVDALLSIAISIYLGVASIGLILDTTKILMQFTPHDIDLVQIKEKIGEMEGVANIHHVHIWQINDNEIHFEGHVEFCDDLPLSQTNETLAKINERLAHDFGITHSVLQQEFTNACNKDIINCSC